MDFGRPKFWRAFMLRGAESAREIRKSGRPDFQEGKIRLLSRRMRLEPIFQGCINASLPAITRGAKLFHDVL